MKSEGGGLQRLCRDLKASVVVGVHCDKKREGEPVEKCHWLRRL